MCKKHFIAARLFSLVNGLEARHPPLPPLGLVAKPPLHPLPGLGARPLLLPPLGLAARQMQLLHLGMVTRETCTRVIGSLLALLKPKLSCSYHYNPWCRSPHPVRDIYLLTPLAGRDQLAGAPGARSLPW